MASSSTSPSMTVHAKKMAGVALQKLKNMGQKPHLFMGTGDVPTSTGKVFGNHLSHIIEERGEYSWNSSRFPGIPGRIPRILGEMVEEFIHNKYYKFVGCFRIEGDKKRVKALQNRIDSGENLSSIPTDANENRVVDVTTLIKRFVRDLNECLATDKIVPKLLRVYTSIPAERHQEREMAWANLLCLLPEDNFKTLLYIVHLIEVVDAHKQVNKMDIGNLIKTIFMGVIKIGEELTDPTVIATIMKDTIPEIGNFIVRKVNVIIGVRSQIESTANAMSDEEGLELFRSLAGRQKRELRGRIRKASAGAAKQVGNLIRNVGSSVRKRTRSTSRARSMSLKKAASQSGIAKSAPVLPVPNPVVQYKRKVPVDDDIDVQVLSASPSKRQRRGGAVDRRQARPARITRRPPTQATSAPGLATNAKSVSGAIPKNQTAEIKPSQPVAAKRERAPRRRSLSSGLKRLGSFRGGTRPNRMSFKDKQGSLQKFSDAHSIDKQTTEPAVPLQDTKNNRTRSGALEYAQSSRTLKLRSESSMPVSSFDGTRGSSAELITFV